MVRPKGTAPVRNAGTPIRLTEAERRYVDAAMDREFKETLRAQGVSRPVLATFLRAAAFDRAERILGASLEEFEQKQRRREKE
jgi:hypothetical protein